MDMQYFFMSRIVETVELKYRYKPLWYQRGGRGVEAQNCYYIIQ